MKLRYRNFPICCIRDTLLYASCNFFANNNCYRRKKGIWAIFVGLIFFISFFFGIMSVATAASTIVCFGVFTVFPWLVASFNGDRISIKNTAHGKTKLVGWANTTLQQNTMISGKNELKQITNNKQTNNERKKKFGNKIWCMAKTMLEVCFSSQRLAFEHLDFSCHFLLHWKCFGTIFFFSYLTIVGVYFGLFFESNSKITTK